jgi:hypothetical protein
LNRADVDEALEQGKQDKDHNEEDDKEGQEDMELFFPSTNKKRKTKKSNKKSLKSSNTGAITSTEEQEPEPIGSDNLRQVSIQSSNAAIRSPILE